MGYLTDIIKDSRLNLAFDHSPASVPTDAARQASQQVPEAGAPAPDDPIRHPVGPQPPARAKTRAVPPAPVPGKPRPALPETDTPEQSKPEPISLLRKSRTSRGRSIKADESNASGKPNQAAGLHRAAPIIQRQVQSAAATGTAPAAAAKTVGPAAGRGLPNSPQFGRPAARGTAASSRPPGPVADAAIGKQAARRRSPVEPEQTVTAPHGARPVQPQAAVVASAAPQDAAEQNARSNHSAAAAQAVGPARLSDTPARSVSPAPLMEAGRRMEAVDGISAGKPAGPQVQIGQVNVIVEEKRVPPKSQNDHRGDDSASRTFLRSL